MLDSTQVKPDENIQYNFAYLIDTSDSVGTNTLQQAKDAYTSLTKSLMERGIADVSTFAIIPFGSDASLQTPENATEVISTIEGLSGNGFTNFNAALETANQFFSNAPSGARNITYFLSDGFSTIGGSFDDSAKALQEVADVQAYGFGPANIQQLRIIDSDRPEIVPEASQLATKFSASVGGLVVSDPQDVDSKTDGNKENEITSTPPNEANQAVEDSPSNDISQEVIKEDEENLVDNSVVETPLKLPEPQTSLTPPELEVSNIAELGGNLEPLTGGDFPVINIEDVSILEGDIGSSVAQFTVNLSSPAAEEIQLSYQTVDGSATSGSDYNQASGQITIPIGETSAKIDVEVIGDSQVEPNEEFALNLKELSSEAEYSKIAVIENDDVVQNSPIITQNQAPITQTANNQNIFDGNLLDLESSTGEVKINFTVDGQASYDNTVGFYRIDDTQGTITDPITGNQFKPSDGEAYAELAIRLQEPDFELSPDGQSSITIEDTLLGGYLYAPFIIANGDADSLEGDFSQVYFSFTQANSDKVEHVRSLGNNTLGFEDMLNGGDNDFNDVIIQAEITDV
ncbi:MAG: Calx-beta domain-containing protein [Cyanobacteria bacterium P01_D01_bin.116]